MKLSTKAQQSLEKVITRFKTGDLSPIIRVAGLKRKGEPVPFDNWSLCNRVMTHVQSGGSTDLRGYRQWQNVGRQVQRGSRASYILVPRFVTETDTETGEEIRQLRGFMTVAVFPYKSTEGNDLPEHDYEPKELPPLSDVADRFDISVLWGAFGGRALGSTDQQGKQITLNTHEAKVWFHELAHAIHARLAGGLKGGQHADQETIAEFTACVLAELYGHGDQSGSSWKYISQFNSDPLKAIMKALNLAGKVLEELGV